MRSAAVWAFLLVLGFAGPARAVETGTPQPPLAKPAAAATVKKPAQRTYAELSEAERRAHVAEARAVSPLAARLERVSAPFIGTPYGDSPLGEGSGHDPDPRLRWDLVDCVTFVETAMALALAPSLDEVLEVLDDVRYAAHPPSFVNRNHVTEAQWLPNNQLKGYVREVASRVAPEGVIELGLDLAPDRWRRRRRPAQLPLSPEDAPRGTFRLPVLPLEAAMKHEAEIPPGTLLFVVRRERPDEVSLVTHAGLVLETSRGRVLRHAARQPYLRVIDEPLGAFLRRNARYDKRPVLGVALYEVLEPPPAGRVSADDG